MMLREELENIKEHAPEALQDMIRSEAERLDRSGLGARCLKAGDRAPAFVLPNQHGVKVSAQALLHDGALVVAFYRGGW